MSDAAGVCNMCDAKMAVTGRYQLRPCASMSMNLFVIAILPCFTDDVVCVRRCQPGKYTLAYGLPSWVDAAEPYKVRNCNSYDDSCVKRAV